MEVIDAAILYAKAHRPRALTTVEKIDILVMQATLRQQGDADVSTTVAKLLRRKKALVQDVWRQFKSTGSVAGALSTGNTATHSGAIPDTPSIATLVQRYVRERRLGSQRTVAKDVLAYLEEAGLVTIDRDSDKSVASGLRMMRRWLKKLGYQRGRKKGKMSNYQLNEANVSARADYVAKMLEATQVVDLGSRRTVVYTDESYCHHHYANTHDSLFDPNDLEDKTVKEKHKGQRFCFVGAIVDQGPQVDCEFIALDIFQGGKNGKHETKDYHGMFDHDYYVEWFAGLLTELKAMGVVNAVIVLDNAKYHKGKPKDTPKYKDLKASLQAACIVYGIDHAPTDTKPTLWSKIKAHIDAHVDPVIVTMARAAGHDVWYSPPYHSDLQPIELIWAVVKNEVGRQYTSNTKFTDVYDRLLVAFDNLSPATIQGCMYKAEGHLLDLARQLVAMQSMDNQANIGE